MWNKLLWMWIKGSAALIALLIISLVFKTGMQPLVEVSSPTWSWILTFLVALTPVGAAGGYIVIFFVGLIFHLIFGSSDKEKVSTTTYHTSKKSCPFTGKVYFENDYQLFGHQWEKNKESLVIESDWSITAYAHGKLGWVDTAGAIHDNIPLLGEIDPEARLSGGDTGLSISNGNIWSGNTRVANIRKR